MLHKLLICAVLFAGFCRADIFQKNKSLGRGVNLGNMYEAPNMDWGEKFDVSYLELIAQKGFQTVRIPIQWFTQARSALNAPYTINPVFFEEIDAAVDFALKKKLNVIINMHHYNTLFENPEKEWERFKALWKQIALHYKDYPENLLFEILNEPNTKLTPKKWNMLLAETFPIIRESNPTRPVIIGTAEWGGVAALSKLVLPKDPNIILTIHYYSPMEFTHQGASWVKNSNAWLGTKWQGTYFQKLAIVSDFDYARHYAKKNNIPVFIGEFGALETADIESREKWNAFCTRLFEKYGFSWAYWEFSSGFGVYNNDSKKWNDALLNALMSSDTSILAMGKPKLGKNILKNGDFSRDTSSWYLQIIDSLSEVTFSTDSNGFTIKPGKKDTLGYYIQLTQFKINLKKGRSYVLMFDISAASERSIAAYSGLARAPWDKYYGSNWNVTAFGQIRTIAIPFTMTEDDPEARVSFDFGGDTVETTLANVKLLDLDEAAIKITRYKPFDTGRITAYPVRNGLLVNLNRPFRGKVSASIFSPYGKVMVRVHDIVPDNNSTFALPFSNRTQNLWILHVTSSLFSESILLNNF